MELPFGKETNKKSNSWITTEFTLFLAYVVMLLFFSIASPYFFNMRNFLNIGLYSSIVGTSAVGMTLVLLSGDIDLSVGATMGLVGVAMAIMLQANYSMPLVVFCGLLIGTLCGLINGLIITKLRINAFIATLSTMAIFRGLAFVVCGGLSILITAVDFRWFGRGYLLNIPVSLIVMVVLFIIFGYILKNTKFGRRIYAIGGNPRASYLSGINVKRNRIWVFTISGFTAGLGGFLMASQTGSGLPQAGQGMELDVIAAVVLGGTSLAGGRGKIIGTFLGVLMMSTLSNGMILMNVPSFYQQIAKGCVLLLAVMVDTIRVGSFKDDSE